jgi:tetratricopeptide (TPR) repeat protein
VAHIQLTGYIYSSLGVAFYKTKDFDSSFEAFRETLQVDPTNASAKFYSGLILQSQEQYDQSLIYFNRAKKLEPGYKQLGLYYKGLAYYKMEKSNNAKDLFSRAVAYDPQSETAKNALALIDVLDKREKAGTKKPWNVSFSSGIEWNDNVTRIELDNISNQSDTSSIFEGSLDYHLLKKNKFTLDSSYNFYQSLFDDATEFDYQSHTGSLTGSYAFGAFDASLNYSYAYSFLDKRSFASIHTFSPGIAFSLHPLHYSAVNYRYEYRLFFSDPARDGPNHSIEFNNFLFFMEGKVLWSTGYRFSDDNTAAPQFDFGGHATNTALKFEIPWESEVSFSYELNSRNYKNITQSIGEERKDDKQTFQVSYSKNLFTDYHFDFNYRHIEAKSNLESVDFTENSAFIGLGAHF